MHFLRLPLLAVATLPVLLDAGAIRFTGNNALSTTELARIEVRLAERGGELVPDPAGAVYTLGAVDASRLGPEAVARIVQAISAHYQSRDVLATRAEVTSAAYAEAQGGGDLVVRIVEGRVDDVRVATVDGTPVSESTRARVLGASPVTAGGSLDGAALDDTVAQLNRFAAARVHPVLFAASEGLVLEYRVAPAAPFKFAYTIDNYGSERTGEVRHTVEASAQGLASEHDRLSVTGILTSSADSRYLRAEYFLPLGALHKHRLRASVYHASYTAEDIGALAFDFEGESTGAILAYETTLLNRDGRFLDLSVGAHFVDASQDQSSVGIPEASSGFFLPYVDLRLSSPGAALSWVGGVRLETNLPDLGGTGDLIELSRLGRFNASDDFTIGRLYGGVRLFLDPATRVHEVLANGAYIASLSGDRLPASFLNVTGGHATARGYPVAAVSGDQSAYAQLEYRFHGLRLLEKAPEWDASLALFLDLAEASNEDPLPFEYDDGLASFGVGLHVSYRDRFRAGIEYAQVIKDIVTPYTSIESGDNQVYFTASLSF
ncbi:MAG: ShlB/FhaC/HecB family hemolysin secretion/activation protein [Opitutales bacterium]